MPTLLIVHCPVATGKSSVVERLLPQLKGFVFVDRAAIKHNLKALGTDGAKEVARQAVYLLLEESLRRDADILVQEVDPEAVRRRLGLLLDEHGYRLLSFRLEASWETTLARNEARGKNVTAARMREIWDAYPAPSPLDIVIDTETRTPEEIVRTILEKVKC